MIEDLDESYLNQVMTNNMKDPLRFETDRYIVRPLRPADVNERYVSWWNDAEIQEGNNRGPQKWDRNRALEHINWFDNKNNIHFGIFRKQNEELVGFMTLLSSSESGTAKSNVVLDKSVWGENVVPEVRRILIDYAFNTLGARKFKGLVVGRNYPSIFNYLAMGFTCEGVMRSEAPSVKGGFCDVFHFAIFKDEWEKRSQKSGE